MAQFKLSIVTRITNQPIRTSLRRDRITGYRHDQSRFVPHGKPLCSTFSWQNQKAGELLFLIFRVSPSETLNTHGSKILPSTGHIPAGDPISVLKHGRPLAVW